MGRKYANPPVVEAVCEFRLTPDTPWDMTIPGLVYEKLRDEFPQREQRLLQEVELTQGPEGLQQQIRTSERILFLVENRKTFVQIGPRLLAINALKPYPTWAGFKPKIERAFEALNRTVEIRGLERIGLRYINRIEIPSSPVRLENYFQFYVFLGPRLPQDMADFIVGGEFAYANGRDRCRVQLKPAPSSSPECAVLVLDIDYFLAQEKGVEVRAAIDWVEEAHDKVEEVFEGCITDSLRNLFQEVR